MAKPAQVSDAEFTLLESLLYQGPRFKQDLVAELGTGGRGTAAVAWERAIDSLVAKALVRHVTKEVLERYRREAEAAVVNCEGTTAREGQLDLTSEGYSLCAGAQDSFDHGWFWKREGAVVSICSLAPSTCYARIGEAIDALVGLELNDGAVEVRRVVPIGRWRLNRFVSYPSGYMTTVRLVSISPAFGEGRTDLAELLEEQTPMLNNIAEWGGGALVMDIAGDLRRVEGDPLWLGPAVVGMAWCIRDAVEAIQALHVEVRRYSEPGVKRPQHLSNGCFVALTLYADVDPEAMTQGLALSDFLRSAKPEPNPLPDLATAHAVVKAYGGEITFSACSTRISITAFLREDRSVP